MVPEAEIKETAEPRYWKIASGRGGESWDSFRDGGYVGVNWLELGDVSAIDREQFDQRAAEAMTSYAGWTKIGAWQVWTLAHEIRVGDRIVANRGISEVVGIGTVIGPYRYLGGEPYGHRLPVRWDDLTLRRIAPHRGWRRTLVSLSAAEFQAILDTPPASEAQPAPAVERPVDEVDRYFTEPTFDLLAGLRDTPTREYYLAHKDECEQYLTRPFRVLFADLAGRLPAAATPILETGKRLLAALLKNDYGRGGANDYYWGAFYLRGLTRSTSPQLSVWIDGRLVSIGFDIGDNGAEPRARFRRNVAAYREALLALLDPFLEGESLHYGKEEQPIATLAEWLAQPELETRACVNLSREQVLAMSCGELAGRAAGLFRRLYPFVILAASDDPLAEIRGYVSEEGGAVLPEVLSPPNPVLTLAQISADTGFAVAELQRWLRALARKKQAVLYGPPGTGKTFLARKLAQHLVGGTDGLVELVQFHPAYAYEDFVQGIRPQSCDGALDYPVVPGRFLAFCAEARRRSGPCVLIIDEINRANLARVFGELMVLLEYRDQAVPLAADGAPFAIPGNVRLIGTMNTADRSIALVDHALRRRFAFIELAPQYDVLAKRLAGEPGIRAEELVEVLRRLNHAIEDRHYAVGISFFLVDHLAEEIEDIWRMEIQPYLDEYFFDRPQEAARFAWDQVCDRILAS